MLSPSDGNSCLFSLHPNISDDSHFGVERKPTKKDTVDNTLSLMDKMASPSPSFGGQPGDRVLAHHVPPWHPPTSGPVRRARSAVLCTVTPSNGNVLHNTGKHGNVGMMLACLLDC